MEKLTATEFARLTHLLAKGDQLSDEEQKEKADFEAKLVASSESESEPSKDSSSEESDEETETEEQEPEETSEGEESDEEEEEEQDPEEEDPAAAANLTIGQRMTALITSRKNLTAKLSAANARNKELTAAVTTLTTRATKAEASAADLKGKLDTTTAQVTTLEAAAKALDEAVVDELSAIGVAPSQLAEVDTDGKGSAIDQAYEDFRTAEGPDAKAEAYKKLQATQRAAEAKKNQN